MGGGEGGNRTGYRSGRPTPCPGGDVGNKEKRFSITAPKLVSFGSPACREEQGRKESRAWMVDGGKGEGEGSTSTASASAAPPTNKLAG